MSDSCSVTTKLCIEKGSTYRKTFQWLAEDEVTPIDLTGYSARMQIRSSYESTDYILELTTENGGISITPLDGKINLYIPESITSKISEDVGVFDIELIIATDVYRFLKGSVRFDKNVTKPVTVQKTETIINNNYDFSLGSANWFNSTLNPWTSFNITTNLQLVSDGTLEMYCGTSSHIEQIFGNWYIIEINCTLNSGILPYIEVVDSIDGDIQYGYSWKISASGTTSYFFKAIHDNNISVRFKSLLAEPCNLIINSVKVYTGEI